MLVILKSSQIAESFRRFGIADESKNILAIKVSHDADQVSEHLRQHVEGTLIPFSDAALAQIRDSNKIRKYYRLEAPKKGQEVKLGQEAEAFVLGSMALKGS